MGYDSAGRRLLDRNEDSEEVAAGSGIHGVLDLLPLCSRASG